MKTPFENVLIKIIICLFCILVIIENTEAGCMQEIHFCGTHYDFGYCIGNRFKNEIANILANYSYMPRLNSWYNSGVGNFINVFEGKGLSTYNNYGDEIRGMAAGAGVTEDEIYLLNLEAEVRGYNGDSPRSATGTENTEMYYADGSIYSGDAFFGHFVALDNLFKDMLFVANVKIVDETTGDITQQFRSVMIPGYLAGTILNYNSYGVITSPNRIFETTQPLQIRNPLCFTMRDIVMATSAADAKSKLTDGLSSTVGVHLNILHSGTNYTSYEFHVINTFQSSESLYEYTGGSSGMLPHFNILQRVSGTAYLPMGSLFRSATASSYLLSSPPVTEAAFTALMGSVSQPVYPFYRDSNTFNDYSTLVTAIVDIANSKLNLYLGNPNGALPDYVTSTASYGT